jgi:hypothetical protein
MATHQYNPLVEVWKAIPDYPGYEVSDHGQVRSYWKRIKKQGFVFVLDQEPQRLLSQPKSSGYYIVGLLKDKKQCKFRVHTLVLLTFDGPPPPKHECRHLDGTRTNNHFPNLRWGTRLENTADCILHGRKVDPPRRKPRVSGPYQSLTQSPGRSGSQRAG